MKKIEHEDFLLMRAGAEVLEADSFGEKVLQLVDGTMLKLFRRKRLFSSAAWYPYASRFADNAVKLERLGISVPRVIDVMRIGSISRDAVHYHPLEGSTLRALSRQGLDAETELMLKSAFNTFVVSLHDRGVYFRSLHLGNVVLSPDGCMGLIDFSDLRIYRRPLGNYMRLRNVRRLQKTDRERDWLDIERITGKRGNL